MNFLMDNTFHCILADFGLVKKINFKKTNAFLKKQDFDKPWGGFENEDTDSDCNDDSDRDQNDYSDRDQNDDSDRNSDCNDDSNSDSNSKHDEQENQGAFTTFIRKISSIFTSEK
mmetsp:Transcript_7063/g.8011  ORF Transcript_7063/g.8011 Transcript_7063/m.8011 type:complete len:115 (+) Transcript_7063:166-510(+)